MMAEPAYDELAGIPDAGDSADRVFHRPEANRYKIEASVFALHDFCGSMLQPFHSPLEAAGWGVGADGVAGATGLPCRFRRRSSSIGITLSDRNHRQLL